MDAGKINDALLQNLQQRQVEQVQLISKLVGVKLGESFIAQVQQLGQASPAERAELLEHINRQLQQLNPNSAAPATRALINQLLSQQAMVQSSQLMLVRLEAMQGANHSPLAYTNQPLAQGQILLIKLDATQRLVILGSLTGVGQAQLAASALSSTSLNPTQLAGLLQPLGNAQPTPPANLSSNNTLEILRTNLSNLLPRKDQGADLVGQVQLVLQQAQQLPVQERNQWFSSQLQQALKTLANQLRNPAELSHPKLFAQAVRNSGVFFEHKLAQTLSNPTAPPLSANTQSPGATATTTAKLAQITAPNSLSKSSAPAASATATDIKAAPSANATAQTNTTAQTNASLRQDLKGALLAVLHDLEQELLPLLPPGSQPASLAATTAKPSALNNVLAQLLGWHLLPEGQEREATQKNLRSQLLLLLHQQTLGSLAKIQLQQLHSLNHQLEQADSPLPSQSWQLEIPLRQGQELQHLHLHLEYQWVDEQKKDDANETPANKIRQWQVMLSFDMASLGKFYVQLTLAGKSLSANFWAEQQATLEKARARMAQLQQQLEQEGLEINAMQCLNGLPPQPKISLGYSLVDVKT